MLKLTEAQSIYLDLVRGLSAVTVLIGHSLSLLPDPPRLGTLYPVQSYAVVIFFVLSGFLICLSTVSKKGYTFGEYTIDRFSRIYVALFPTLILIYIVDTFITQNPANKDIGIFFANAALLMGIPFERIFSVLPYFEPLGSGRPLWTVAVEWWMYISFGFLFFAKSIKGPSLLLALILFPVSFAVLILYGARESLAIIWFVGVALAIPIVTLNKARARQLGLLFLITSIGLLFVRLFMLHAGASSINFYDQQFMLFTEAAIFSGLIVVKGYSFAEIIFLNVRRFSKWLAEISYSLYLTHYTLLLAFNHIFGMSWLNFFIFIFIAILFSWIFTLAFDRWHKTVSIFLKGLILRTEK